MTTMMMLKGKIFDSNLLVGSSAVVPLTVMNARILRIFRTKRGQRNSIAIIVAPFRVLS